MAGIGPWIAPVGSFVSGVITNALNAREARRNREFQERMSSTAHQREVADLRLAGLNPFYRNLGGAEAPAGDRAEFRDPSEAAINSALAVRRQRSEISLIDAQRQKTEEEASALGYWRNAGRFDQFKSEVELSKLTVEQRRQEMKLALQRAKAEIEQMVSSARAARASAMLDEAAREGALNREEFERVVGEAGPMVRFFLEILRGLRR